MQAASRGNLAYYAPPCGGGVGGGATILWARNMCQKGSVRSVSSVREKTSTKYASSPVGVTSHTTPLPAGEGLGEGPLSCGVETCAKMLC